MRTHVLAALIACTLCACAPSTPESAPQATPTVAPPKAGEPATATAMPQPVTPPAAAPAKEVPEGDCGDQSALPADQRVANTARWTTASEQNNFGFDVFRGDAEKGPFAKLTKEPILGAGTSDETHKYEYRDDTVDPCKDYWYYVEGISTSGSHEKFTPTFRAPAKVRARGSSANPPATPAPTQAQPAQPAAAQS
jgi:hypothetical protein